MIVTLGYVWPRPGELCVLRRDDLDVGARELTVRFTLDGTGRERPPKNGKPRVVTVPPPTRTAVDWCRSSTGIRTAARRLIA